MIKWLQNNLIPCPFKKLTGFDCPGCGFQRSVVELLKGNLNNSLHLYPATIPILFLVLFAVTGKRWPYNKNYDVKRCLYLATGGIIVTSYLFKIGVYYLH